MNVRGPNLRKYAIIGLISLAPQSIRNRVNNASMILRKRINTMVAKIAELY
jgi:hypothetical protein